MNKRMFIIAGPNGAGKTTTAQSLFPNFLNDFEFINADEIARGLSPLRPESMSLIASKLMLKRFRELRVSNKNFAFETTASAKTYIKYLNEAQKNGYIVHLLFLWLSSPELAIKRVARRVLQGGHNVEPEVIRRRYFSGLKNLVKYYLPIADIAHVMDNSVSESRNIIVKKLNKNEPLEIKDVSIWETIQKFGA